MEDETLQLIKGNKTTPIKMALGVNADSLATWFRPVLAMLYEELDVSVELVVDDQDHTAQLMQRGEVMGCVSVDAETPKGFVADYLGSMRYLCVANKRFAARYLSDGLTMDAVLQTNAVLFNRKDKIHDNFLAAHMGVSVSSFPKHYIPSPEGLYDAVAVGMGYGLVPEEQAKNDLRTGKLVNLAPDMPLDIALYWHHWSIEPNISVSVTSCVKKCASASLYNDDKLISTPRHLRAIG
jgi:LysR family transcriptional regulator (chromosome initiation inhibitor)